MKVVFITHYAELYGANRSLLNLIDGLVPLGVKPFVIVPYEGDIISALRERGIQFLLVPHELWSDMAPLSHGLRGKFANFCRVRREAFRRLIANLRLIPHVARQLKTWDIDIIYTNSSVILLGALLARWMRKPHVWHLREFGDLDYNLNLDWGKSLSDFVMRRANAQICVSEAVRSHYASGLIKGKSHVIYNGVATEVEMERLHRTASTRSETGSKFVFALVGLIHPSKGQETAIRALGLLKDSFPGVRLIIAGEGCDTKPLEELAANCGVSEQVTFIGYTKNPFEVYLQSDAVLMCSKNEAMGRVTVEAMAAARPVLGYNGGGTAELIVSEFNGLLYKGDEKELASCMRRIVANPALGRGMGEQGWRTAREKYSIETYAESVYEVLSSLLG